MDRRAPLSVTAGRRAIFYPPFGHTSGRRSGRRGTVDDLAKQIKNLIFFFHTRLGSRLPPTTSGTRSPVDVTEAIVMGENLKKKHFPNNILLK